MGGYITRTCLIILALGFCAFGEPVVEPGDKKLPMPGEALKFNGRDAFVISPKEAAKESPWVWYAPTLPRLPDREKWMFKKFLDAGVAIAGVDVGESYGSPEGRSTYHEFYTYLTEKRGLSKKPCLLARSRGGLMLYSWATEYPKSVGGIAGIYPVCSITSYPGVSKAAPAYKMSVDELRDSLAKVNPVDRLESLAKANVPILHIHGDNDKVVPLEDNSMLLKKRYESHGGKMNLIVIPGGGHDVKPHWFESEELTNFAIKHAKGQ